MRTVRVIEYLIKKDKTRSAWEKGVNKYALKLLDMFDQSYELNGDSLDEEVMLDGTSCWSQYSNDAHWASLTSKQKIAERLCSSQELEFYKDGLGLRNPLNGDTWLDVQARALCQASDKILKLARLTD